MSRLKKNPPLETITTRSLLDELKQIERMIYTGDQMRAWVSINMAIDKVTNNLYYEQYPNQKP